MNLKIYYFLFFVSTFTICYRPSQCKPLNINSTDIGHDFANSKNDNEYHGNLDENTKKQLRQCDMDLETEELCMRCAKITKSTIVYPLCCANEDDIKQWCHDYIFFGA